MKGLNGGIPLAVLAATAHAQGIYKGPHGDDTGNAASVGHKNEAEFETTQDIKDDHSWKGPGPWPGHPYYPPPHAWGPWKRGDINEGPTGDDTGNAAAVGNENEAESETNQDIKDDHSWKGPGPWYPHPYYPGPPPHAGGHWKRGDINEGPTGDDTGNAASVGHENEAESETTQHIKDDHSWKGPGPWYPHPYYPGPPPHAGGHWKRGDINEGPTGDDTGNAANIGHKNEAEFETNQDIKDDHSWKGHPAWPYWYPGAPYPYPYPGPPNHGENRPARGYHTGMKEARDAAGDINEGPNGDDTGNVANIVNTNSASNEYEGAYKDNHSVDIDYSWPFHQKRAFAPSTDSGDDDDEGLQHSPAITNNEMTYPGQDTHGANGEACQASQVTRTVTMTRTHTAMATETAAVEDPEEDPEYFHAAQTPASSQDVQNPNLHSAMASSAAPAGTPVAHGSQASAPEPTSAYHAPAASQITVGEASAYTVIPVYVPSGAAHGSVVIQASSTPASSSAFRTHALPTGASPEQNAASSSSATPSSSHGPVSFTGAAAGKLVPSAGVFTALAGAAALLAFAL